MSKISFQNLAVAGEPSGKIAIAAARFNAEVVERLLTSAVAALQSHGVAAENIIIRRVPGAYELPLLAQQLARQDQVKAVIALGAIIRGETAHFEYVAQACSQGLLQVNLQESKPVIMGVLTVDNLAQALDRCGGKAGDKGAEAALSALEMLKVLGELA